MIVNVQVYTLQHLITGVIVTRKRDGLPIDIQYVRNSSISSNPGFNSIQDSPTYCSPPRYRSSSDCSIHPFTIDFGLVARHATVCVQLERHLDDVVCVLHTECWRVTVFGHKNWGRTGFSVFSVFGVNVGLHVESLKAMLSDERPRSVK